MKHVFKIGEKLTMIKESECKKGLIGRLMLTLMVKMRYSAISHVLFDVYFFQTLGGA